MIGIFRGVHKSWLDFVGKIPPEKEELIEYLKEKRLYVNEAVTQREEM